MATCKKCGRDIPDSEISNKVRKCDYCERDIGCIYCLIPGTLEYRYCEDHNPKGKKDKSGEIKKYISELNIDGPVSKNAEIQLLRNRDSAVGIMIECLESEKNFKRKYEILRIFEKIRDEKTIDSLLKAIKHEYENSMRKSLISQAVRTLAGINTEKSVNALSLLSEHPDPNIRGIVLDMAAGLSESQNYKKLLEKILDGRTVDEVKDIYKRNSELGHIDHRYRENAVRDLSSKKSGKELIQSLSHRNPLMRAYSVMCLGAIGKDDVDIIEKIASLSKDEDDYLRANVAIALGNVCAYDKVFEMTTDKDTNVKISAVDALLSGKDDPKVKQLLSKITEENLLNYINNDEYRYSENVRREINTREKYASEFFAAEMLEECENTLNEILRIDAENFKARMNLAEVYMKTYRYDEAEKELKNAIKIKNDAYAYIMLGDVFLFTSKPEDAVKEYNNALKISEIPEVHKKIAEAYLINEKFEEAAEEYKKIISANPADAQSRNTLGEILEKANKKKEAAIEYENAIKQSPHLFEPHVKLAVILIEEGKFNEAEENLRTAIKIRPTEPLPYFILGISLTNQKRYRDAEREIKRCLSADPSFANSEESAEMHELLAESLTAQGRAREAKTELLKVQRLRNQNKGIRNRRDFTSAAAF